MTEFISFWFITLVNSCILRTSLSAPPDITRRRSLATSSSSSSRGSPDGFITLLREKNIWATSWKKQQCGCAPSEDSDQPGHPPNLIRVFAVRMKKAWVLSYPLSAQRRLIRLGRCPCWSESSLGAQSLCWFCHVVAHLANYYFIILLQCLHFTSSSPELLAKRKTSGLTEWLSRCIKRFTNKTFEHLFSYDMAQIRSKSRAR